MIITCNTTHIENLNEMLSYFNVILTKEEMIDNPFVRYYAYCSNNEFIGFISYSVMYERAELNYIYVKPDYRGTEVASLLIEDMFCKCHDCGVKSITLEVRESNIAAISLYNKFGFETISKRANYYHNEDGLLMEKVLQ